MDDDTPSAARTLDAIRNGGGTLVLSTRQRINEAVKALDDGDFAEALRRLHEAQQTISPLANAQAYIAIADSGRMVRASDLEVGMVMSQLGEITEIAQATCEHSDCPGHFVVTVGDNSPVVLDGDTTIYVEVAADG
jgi:cellobiose-specific phosphotransferase system component IIA